MVAGVFVEDREETRLINATTTKDLRMDLKEDIVLGTTRK